MKLLEQAKLKGRRLRFGKKGWVADNYSKEVAELFVAWFNEEITTSQLCSTIKLPTGNGAYFTRATSVIREGIKRGYIDLKII